MDSKTDRSQKTKECLRDKLEAWVSTGDGERALRQATQAAQECTENLQEKRRLDAAKLNEPFTV
jgi:hypothetical protein